MRRAALVALAAVALVSCRDKPRVTLAEFRRLGEPNPRAAGCRGSVEVATLAYAPKLQSVGRVRNFLRWQRRFPIPSSAALGKIGDAHMAAMQRFHLDPREHRPRSRVQPGFGQNLAAVHRAVSDPHPIVKYTRTRRRSTSPSANYTTVVPWRWRSLARGEARPRCALRSCRDSRDVVRTGLRPLHGRDVRDRRKHARRFRQPPSCRGNRRRPRPSARCVAAGDRLHDQEPAGPRRCHGASTI